MNGCSGPVGNNVRHILETIRSAAARSARNPDSIRLIAATKTVGIERIQEAMSAGVTLVERIVFKKRFRKLNGSAGTI